MAKKEYRLNQHTLTYEVVTAPFRLRSYRFLRKLLLGFILASVVNLVISYFVYTPKMYRLVETNRELVLKLNLLQDRIAASAQVLADIRHRDNYVYRSIFSADTLSLPGVYLPYPDSKYAEFQDVRHAGLITDTWKNLDALTRRLYLESLSLDQLRQLTSDKGKMSLAIPAIWPINRKFLRRPTLSGGSLFGYRADPQTGARTMHWGVDFGSDTGTPVYATGNGVVVRDPGMGTGYGRQVLIDHGYGYLTRYAHLDKVGVEPGRIVKRGEQIGEVGNTGRSFGSHLHYEVWYRGERVNPINYFRSDMSEEEFAKIIDEADDTI